MPHKKLEQMMEDYWEIKNTLPTPSIESYEKAFDVKFAHESTAMEGNTISLIETKLLLEDKISIGGKKLREIYEVINHSKAYDYVKKEIQKHRPLDEDIVKDLHAILMENIMTGGVYRTVDVYITGAQHTPPTPNQMYQQVKFFFADLPQKEKELPPIELAAWTHAEFVRIHPFTDGNGRTSRLLMNYQLMRSRYLPVSIPTSSRLEYYSSLDTYAVTGSLAAFSDLIATLEESELTAHLDMHRDDISQKEAQTIEPSL